MCFDRMQGTTPPYSDPLEPAIHRIPILSEYEQIISMASRRAIVSGLSRLIRQGTTLTGSSSGVLASPAIDGVATGGLSRSFLPAMFQSGRGFAAEPAAAAPASETGKVTQVRLLM